MWGTTGFVAVDALKNGAEAEAGAAGLGGATTGVANGDVTAAYEGGSVGLRRRNSTNCLVKSPGGQPGTSISSATLVKSRSLNGKYAHSSCCVIVAAAVMGGG